MVNINKHDSIVLKNLKSLIGQEFDNFDIICCFPDVDGLKVIISEVKGTKSNYDGYGSCQLYNIYYNHEEATIFNMYVADDETIVDVF